MSLFLAIRFGDNAFMLARKKWIYEYVTHSTAHPTAQEVFDAVRVALKRISLATVYRNLNELVEEKQIRRIEVPDQPDRFDQLFEPHDHLVCLDCGAIVDIPMISHHAETPKGCILEFCKTTAYGYCSNCAVSRQSSFNRPKEEGKDG